MDPEAGFKEKRGVWDPILEYNLTLSYSQLQSRGVRGESFSVLE